MKSDNPIQTKSYAFALRIVKLYRYLCDDNKEYILSKQIVRSGTSIGANIEEAIGAQSSKDFLSKAYAKNVGWTVVSREEAERRRGFDPDALPADRAKGRSLFFDDLLDAKVREFNPRYAEESSDDPYLIALAERAQAVQESFEKRQTSTQGCAGSAVHVAGGERCAEKRASRETRRPGQLAGRS